MSRNRLGIVLSVIGIAAVLWLAAANRLHWYIHPRYLAFTVTMCAIAAVLAVGSAIAVSRRAAGETGAADEHEHDHEHDHSPRTRPRRSLRVVTAVGTAALLVGAVAALLVAPPTTLSAQTAQQRQLKATSTGPVTDSTGGDDPTLQQWGAMLQNGGSEAEGREAEFLGFIVPDDTDPENTFFVTRFVVSCCAVDAQPLGIPVVSPGWSDEFAKGDWVDVDGVFGANADVTSDHAVVLHPSKLKAAKTPDDPYVY